MLLRDDLDALDEERGTLPPGLAAELFRAVNERINELGKSYVFPELNLVCECGDESCTGLFAMAPREFEELRRQPGRFAVLPGHQQPEDAVITHRGGFLVGCHVDALVGVAGRTPRI
jgi:hypothetical protein